jgi:transcriptional regulator PpsR
VQANRAFARLAQIGSERQAEGEPLDRWLGRSGVELQVLLTNLRDGGSPGLLATELRGTLGLQTSVEVAASALTGPSARYAFSLRDTGRRLAPGEEALPKVPSSVKQLSELVGRVPLKQIVAETSDLIEKLSIEAALQMTRDNRALAAQMLGLSRQSLYVKLRRFGMGGLGDAPDAGGEAGDTGDAADHASDARAPAGGVDAAQESQQSTGV